MLVLVLAATALGCSLALDVDSLGDEDCGEGFKACDGECVIDDSPKNGCQRSSCSPCALPNAVNQCSRDGECAIASCTIGFFDCDDEPANGCEIDIEFDPLNCGGCEEVCELPNAVADCSNRRCVVRSCTSGWANCNDEPEDGCESRLAEDDMNCGYCDLACDVGQSCVDGMCQA